MKEAVRKLSFVSGKGGVGKTLLAANFSLYASTTHKTVLIDLDFQNQGASGLLAEYLKPGCLNSFDLLSAGLVELEKLIEVRDNLFFVPAFDPSKSDRFASQPASSSFQSKGVEGLARALDRLAEAGNFNATIIDCHGGLDDSSFAAFIYSDTTFIVTEPDKVTFSGTLELLDFYVGRANAIATSQIPDCKLSREAPLENSIARRITHIEDNKIRFLVNRVSGKFGYRTLKEVLSRQFDANLDIIQKMNQGFSFFPSEPILSESFSEYPFFVELLPESVFSQKIEFLCKQVFGTAPVIKGRSPLYRFFERVSLSKIDTYLKSPYETRVRAVFSLVALTQVVFSVLMIGIGLVSSLGIFPDFLPLAKASAGQKTSPLPFWLPSLLILGMALIFLYLVRFNVLLSGYFRDRLRYEWRLYARGGRHNSISFTLRIVRAFSFRFVLIAWAWLYLLFAVVYGILSVVMLFIDLK
jgi:MinD-like ATPase involved in chromosome partitioning or flagellar assembly